MKKLLILDYYTNKIIEVQSEETLPWIGDKVVYSSLDVKTNTEKKSLGTFIKENADDKEYTDLKGTFVEILQGEDSQRFQETQEEAQTLFPIFKREFKQFFPNSIPVMARYQIYSDQLFFYFYSEERFIFTEFVKELRKKINKNIFLFQVGARDMMRISPATDGMFCSGDVPLCCKRHMIFQNIEIENIITQNIEGRDIERVKGKCWKLKCCLLYEMNVYIEEGKKYPQKWSKIELKGNLACKAQNCENKEVCEGIILSYNIMNQEIKIKTKEWIIKIPLDKFNQEQNPTS